MFCDFPLAVDVWNLFIDYHLDEFYNLEFNEWLHNNLSHSFASTCSFTWNRVWAVTVWQLWVWRNALVHRLDFRRPFRPAEIIKNILNNYDQGRIFSVFLILIYRGEFRLPRRSLVRIG